MQPLFDILQSFVGQWGDRGDRLGHNSRPFVCLSSLEGVWSARLPRAVPVSAPQAHNDILRSSIFWRQQPQQFHKVPRKSRGTGKRRIFWFSRRRVHTSHGIRYNNHKKSLVDHVKFAARKLPSTEKVVKLFYSKIHAIWNIRVWNTRVRTQKRGKNKGLEYLIWKI